MAVAKCVVCFTSPTQQVSTLTSRILELFCQFAFLINLHIKLDMSFFLYLLAVLSGEALPF